MDVKELREVLEERLSSLSDREKRLLLVFVPVLLFVLYLGLVFLPLKSSVDRYRERRELLLKKVNSLKVQLEELAALRSRLNPLLVKVDRGIGLDPSSYVKSVARMVGLQIDSVKVLAGETSNGIERDRLSVSFSQVELNRLARFINRLERGSYAFRVVSVSLSDYDENGLVSGKLTLYFFRRAQ